MWDSKRSVLATARAVSSDNGAQESRVTGRRSIRFRNIAVMTGLFTFVSYGMAVAGGLPLVTSATIDPTAGGYGQITIVGENFPSLPVVTLGGTAVGVVSASATHIVATLQNVVGLSRGAYLLVISKGTIPYAAFVASVGDVGPEGPIGPKGDRGDRGDTGPDGLPGGTGPAGPTGATGPTGPHGATSPPRPNGATGTNRTQGGSAPHGIAVPSSPG